MIAIAIFVYFLDKVVRHFYKKTNEKINKSENKTSWLIFGNLFFALFGIAGSAWSIYSVYSMITNENFFGPIGLLIPIIILIAFVYVTFRTIHNLFNLK